MDAAKDAADAVDDLVQHLSTADALHSAPELEEMMSEAVVNESAATEPLIEEIVQQVQQSRKF